MGAASSVRVAVAALAGPDAHLACAIFDSAGVEDIGVRLGATAGTVTCLRAKWFLGGGDNRILTPAALLDVPRVPTNDLRDPFEGHAQRQRTIDAARAQAAAYVDGVVRENGPAWEVSLVVRAPDGVEIARSEGKAKRFLDAVQTAADSLWKAPLVKLPLDAEVARWTALPDAAAGALFAQIGVFRDFSGCAEVRRRSADLGLASAWLEDMCAANGRRWALVERPSPFSDESPWGLAVSVDAILDTQTLDLAQGRRILGALDDQLRREVSPLGRAHLLLAACRVAAYYGDGDEANKMCLSAAEADPLQMDLWPTLEALARNRNDLLGALAVGSAWVPEYGEFSSLHTLRDGLPERLREAHFGYVVMPELETATRYGRALAEAGRDDEAREVAGGPAEDPNPSTGLRAYVLAFVDLHRARLRAAIAHLEEAGTIGMNDLPSVAGAARLTSEVSTRWAQDFLTMPEADAFNVARSYASPAVLCLNARADLASRCLALMDRLGHSYTNWWGEDGERLLKGAKRYVAGDLRGAVQIWRPLVASTDDVILRVLPTAPFDRAGEHDLAARLDAAKLAYTFIAGVSEAAPREAKRAFAAGDKARARKLAEDVVKAWEVADVEVPAVAEMRALLKQLPPN